MAAMSMAAITHAIRLAIWLALHVQKPGTWLSLHKHKPFFPKHVIDPVTCYLRRQGGSRHLLMQAGPSGKLLLPEDEPGCDCCV